MINVYTRGGRVCNPSGWIYNNVTDWHHGTRWRGARAEWWCATHFEKTKTFLFSFFSFVRSVLIRKMEPEGWGVPLRLTWRNCRIPPLIRNESAAMPAIPSPGSRSCRREAALGAVAVCNGQQHPEQQHADASGCELCRIMRALGDVVTRTGGGGAWQGQQWWPLFTLSLEHTGDTLIIDLRSINIVDRSSMGWNEIGDNIVIFPVNVDLFWNFYILFLILYSLIMLHFKVDWSIIYYFSFSLPLKIIFDWDNLRIRQDFEILFFFKYIMLKSTILLKFYYNFGIFFSLLEKDYFGLGRGKGFWKRCKKEMKRLR